MNTNKAYPHVFQPIKVGTMTLRNRIAFAPMVSGHAETYEGLCTDSLVAYVEAQANTGAGLVTIGSTPVDYDRARDYYGSVRNVDNSDVADLQLLAEAAHSRGAKISIETTHAGRMAYPPFLNGRPAFVPSVLENDDPTKFIEITEEEMQKVLEAYVAAADRCVRGNFDMIMVHMAHGNLLSAFLSPHFNKRTDKYGGSLENRHRFPLAILKAIREKVGRKLNIEIRICGNEYIKDSPTIEDTIAFLKEAQKYIDMVHVSGGMIDKAYFHRFTQPCYYMPHKLNVEYSEKIKAAIDIPVAVVGGITCIEEAEEILASGQADIVAMAKALIADQHLVTKADLGQGSDIRPCLRCYNCVKGPSVGGQIRCAVNPQAGREMRYREVYPSPHPIKAVVVGGGAAGMMAAQTLRRRGHEVTLIEKQDRLGGHLYEAAALSYKDTFRKYINWDIAKTMSCGAKVMTGVTATPELIRELDPDVLVIATGADHIIPPIEGIDLPHVMTVSDAELKRKPVGRRVVMCGGGLSGTECSIDLAKEGHDVTIVDALAKDELCRDVMDLVRNCAMGLVDELGIKTCYSSKVKRITDKGVEIESADGIVTLLEADTVITAFGLRPDPVAQELSGIVTRTVIVGDGNQVGNIYNANTDAFNLTVGI